MVFYIEKMPTAMVGVSRFAGHRPWLLSHLTLPYTFQTLLANQPHVGSSIPGNALFQVCLVPSSNRVTRLGSLRMYASSKERSCQVYRKRQRLDEVCVERFPQYSRSMIQSWILQGKVLVDGRVAGKAGMAVTDKAIVEIIAETPKFVCRAGYKLEAALEKLNIDVAGKVALDSGLSTGGFTDCLLQYGASFVYGVDVGYGQVAERIRTDKRVSVIERTNLRYLSGLPQKVDIVTLDLSFISILLVMPAVIAVMNQESTLVTLIKPQFEARRSQVGGGGIVRDPEVHKEVLEKIINGVEAFGFTNEGWIESPIKGAEGNVEFLACFQRRAENVLS